MLWLISLALLALGIFLSAYFSGVETGFYRVNRMRLAMDARAGDSVSRRLFWLVNRPGWFVATTLVGNNVANNMVTLAIVLAAEHLFAGGGHKVELLATLALAPLVFVYGELIPKSLFYDAPNRLLRRATPLLVGFAGLFSPLSLPLAAFSAVLRRMMGISGEPMQMVFGRRHLERVLHEGHEEGLLLGAQRQLVQGVFDKAAQPVTQAMVPIHRVVGVRDDAELGEVLRLARRHRLADVPVQRANRKREWVGYVNVAELVLGEKTVRDYLRPLVPIRSSESHLHACLRLWESPGRLGIVADRDRGQLGIVHRADLTALMYRAGV